jgi:hypothetical protein
VLFAFKIFLTFGAANVLAVDRVAFFVGEAIRKATGEAGNTLSYLRVINTVPIRIGAVFRTIAHTSVYTVANVIANVACRIRCYATAKKAKNNVVLRADAGRKHHRNRNNNAQNGHRAFAEKLC